MASGAAFHCAFRRQTQQALLEGHERAFAYFGGVFALLRYDNLPLSVRRLGVPAREYLAEVLPGMAALSMKRIAERTPRAWLAAKTAG